MSKAPAFAPLLLALFLAACGRASPTDVPATHSPAESGSPLPAVASPSSTLLSATAGPQAVVTPALRTPTAIVEGLTLRLGTPDPSPNCPDHYPWFFENQATECASTILNTWAVLQPFEHGLMVWLQEGGRTFVLTDDGSPFKPYQLVSDPLGLPLPEP